MLEAAEHCDLTKDSRIVQAHDYNTGQCSSELMLHLCH